ncbi:hypothetical protein KY339_01315 [Candidatus Woesearchaeota archaeon]|nr:hypothetical protein [Candidatus Woesearchaeota archaeon]
MELVLTPAEQGIEKLALELWRNIPERARKAAERVNELFAEMPEEMRQQLEKAADLTGYPQRIEEAKISFANTLLELQENMGEGYAKLESDVLSLLDMFSMKEEDTENFKKQLNDLKEASNELHHAVRRYNSDIKFEEKLKKDSPEDEARIKKRFEDGREYLADAVKISELEQAQETGSTINYMNSFLDYAINKKTEILKLINHAYTENKDVTLLSDLTEALSFPLEKEMDTNKKVNYVNDIMLSLAKGEASIYEATSFAIKVQRLKEQGFDFDTSMDKARNYLAELKAIRGKKELDNGSRTEEEIVDEADKIYREERLEELKAKPFWEKFYPAFIEAATFVRGENNGLQSEEFTRILSERFKTNGGHPVRYATDQLGSEYLINRFITIGILENGKAEVRPIYGEDGNAITPEEAFGLEKPKVKKKGLKLFGLLG